MCLPDGWSANPSEWSDAQRRAVELASETLWRLTAGRFGLCEQTVRPCLPACRPSRDDLLNGGGPVPAVRDGRWVNVTCGCGATNCSCTRVCEIRLPGPVGEVSRVLVDGETLPGPGEPGAVWRVDNRDWLVRIDGGCWPECQDMTAGDDEPGAFTVEYQRGVPVPPGGQHAVTNLAVEMEKQCRGARGCRLPSGTTEVERQGLTYTVEPTGAMSLPEVSGWVSLVNPAGLRQPSAVLTPDLPRPRSTGAAGDRLRLTWSPSSDGGVL